MSRAFARTVFLFVLISLAASVVAPPAAALTPIVVKTVPWVASNPLVPHDTWSGKTIRLKGTSGLAGGTVQYTWDFGDGSPVTAPVIVATSSDMYKLEAQHAYTGATGTVFTARLTVLDTSTGATGSKEYYVAIRDKTQQVESNVAIDEGLWALHKAMYRWDSGGVQYGDWRNWGGYYGAWAVNINAFEVNGHLEDSSGSNPYSADDPYTETVARAMHRLFELLTYYNIGPQMYGNPDGNGNGIAILLNQNYPMYQTGMVTDAIVASGTPTAVPLTGPTNVIGRQYKDIVQDMVDWYSYCQYDDATHLYGGAWRYNCQDFPDNSVAQWGAIGLIAAERNWGVAKLGPTGVVVPQWVKDQNVLWLNYSQNLGGYFGYTDSNPVWGPYATTPSGMVQMVMDGLGRGNTPPPGQTRPDWQKAETFLRDNWCNGGSYGSNIKAYFYGLFSFTKSMLLHDPAITLLHSNTAGVLDIDWYGAELSQGAPCDGVARNLIARQLSDGTWWWNSPLGTNDADGNQAPFETAWAIIMLNRTLFEAGAPVAVAKATPNPGVAGGNIKLDGSASFHQDASRHIVKWEWDTNNDGVYELSGPLVNVVFATQNTYPVTLKVTDDNTPPKTALTVIQIQVTHPPVAPTANAGGSYTFCPGPAKWFLDGSASVNPDDGQSEPGYPGDYIKEYAWDLLGHQTFNDRFGVKPDVTGFWGTGDYIISLRVTDNTATSFPNSGKPDLTSTDSAQVHVMDSCTCISNLTPYAKSRLVQLTWTDPFKGQPNAADHYNIYRSMVSGGPYSMIGSTTSTYSVYLDTTVTNNVTYFYVVRQAMANGWEYCQSNQVQATPRALFPR